MIFQRSFQRIILSVFTLIIGTATTLYPHSLQAASNLKIELTPNPNPPDTGENLLNITLKDAEGKPALGVMVEALFYMPAMGTMPYMEERVIAKERSTGLYVADYDLSMGGTWEITITAESGEGKEEFYFSLTTGIPGIVDKNIATPSGATTGGTTVLRLGPDRLQRIGVRFAEAKSESLTKRIRSTGVVEQDRTHRAEVTLRYDGYVVRQFRGRVGETVKRGDPLFSVYSPDLVSAQNEYLLTLRGQGGHTLRDAARERLKNLGMSEREIEVIKQTGVPKRDVVITAPAVGTILEINVNEGAAVNAGRLLYAIGDLSRNFINARVIQHDVANITVGQRVEINFPGAGESASGQVDLIFPQVEQGVGTANIRIRVEELVKSMRPGAYAEVIFPIDLGTRLAIPTEAVLYSGRNKYVFVDRGAGVLEPRAIETGDFAGDLVAVISGLTVGERVAASGTFLISSEAQLRSALPKWLPAEEKAP